MNLEILTRTSVFFMSKLSKQDKINIYYNVERMKTKQKGLTPIQYRN